MRGTELKTKLKAVKRLIIFIALSLAFHLILQSGLFELADYFKSSEFLPRPTQIELVENDLKTELKIKPLIKQLNPHSVSPPPDQSLARFDSEQTQRVHQETQARNTGLTRNSNQKKYFKNQKNQTSENLSQSSDLPEFTKMNYSKAQTESIQESAISQILPKDIQFSDATNLNTDSNTYYSFYNRVEELFYVRWSERLQSYWDRLSYDFKKNHLGGKVWSTVIEVWLLPSGEFHSAYIHQSSGYPPFDEATVFAFKDARFFPNPPKAKVEPDGYVRLKYRFNVHVGSLP